MTKAIPWIIGGIIVLAFGLLALIFVPRAFGPTGIDSAARIEIERLRFVIDALEDRTKTLEDRLRQLEESRTAPRPRGPDHAGRPFRQEGPNAILDAYAELVLIADRLGVNAGLEVATPDFLEETFGKPSHNLGDDCSPMVNDKLRSLLELRDVGPIRVHMLSPAIESLARVFENVRAADPDLYGLIASSGSLCVRQIRGSMQRASSHAFGLALDINIAGQLDSLADGRTQLGLILMADYFRAEGWIWGAGFSREDSMHFEVSRGQIETWRAAGRI